MKYIFIVLPKFKPNTLFLHVKIKTNMGQLTRELTRLLPACLFLYIVYTVSIINCDRTENEDRYLRIPALGRIAHLGQLYNEVLDEFRDVSAFRQAIPEEFITKGIKPKLTTISGPASNYMEKFKLLNIQETVAANFLAGFTEVDGSASFLNDENFQRAAPNEVSGALIQKYRTVIESLQVCYSNLKGLYNVDILNHKYATHVVTRITYGADIAVLFKGNGNTAAVNLEIANAKLHEQIELLNGPQLEAIEINSTFTMSLTSDVPLPFKTTKNLTDVYNLLREMPMRISNFTDGKGLPVTYALTPLTVIKQIVLPNSEPSNSAQEITIWLLKEIISYFDDIAPVERQLSSIYNTLHSQPNCLPDEANEKLERLKSSVQIFKANLKTQFHEALKADRMTSGPNRALHKLSQELSSSQLGANKFRVQLSQFHSDLKRTEFCARLTASHPHIEYVGHEQNFDLKISQHVNQSVYVLFTKAEFTNNNNNEWQANLYTFLNELNQPENKLHIVDCDFRQAMCKNVSQSVIHLYRNGRLASRKVECEYQEGKDELKSQISQLKGTLVNMSAAVDNKFAIMKTEVTNIKTKINVLVIRGEMACDPLGTSTARCPEGYLLTGGGYQLVRWWEGDMVSPEQSYAEDTRTWRIVLPGAAGFCTVPVANCIMAN